jgi:starvation-inducible DNA-binding protein
MTDVIHNATYTDGVPSDVAERTAQVLQTTLDSTIDLSLTLKHVHWNVAGPHFIAIHTMLDPQVDAVREMTDDIAELIAALVGAPDGRLRTVSSPITAEAYPFGRYHGTEHMRVLTSVYKRVIEAHRSTGQVLYGEPVTQDLLIGQLRLLEKFQWLVRAHAEQPDRHVGR